MGQTPTSLGATVVKGEVPRLNGDCPPVTQRALPVSPPSRASGYWWASSKGDTLGYIPTPPFGGFSRGKVAAV